MQAIDGRWRITWNPLAWGNPNAEVVCLGFSKGPTQAGALAGSHDAVAYKGKRDKIGAILAHLGLLPTEVPQSLKRRVDALIADRNGKFHFGSLIRCTVERFDQKASSWTGTGGGMLDRFTATPFGLGIAERCSSRFLSALPASTRLVIMFGLGQGMSYVPAARRVIERACPGPWRAENEVAYTNGSVMVVHTEHFASQGSHLKDWIGQQGQARGRLGRAAQAAVRSSGVALVPR